MTKIQDIDVAFIETLKAHPDYSTSITYLLYDNATAPVYVRNFTSKNMARTRISRLDSRDFIEYIVKNAVIIYHAYQEVMTSKNKNIPTGWYDRYSFVDIQEISKAIELIQNPKVNIIFYYNTHPNELFGIANAVAQTRFNQRFYNNGTSYTSDPNKNGTEFRYQLDRIGTPLAQELLDKVTHDAEEIKPVTKLNVNYESVNRCLREVVAGTQVKYAHSEYALDGTLFATQDVGRKRDNQEDSVIILTHPDNDKFKLIAVADGVGGLDGGELASNYVVKELAEWFKQIPADAYYITSGLKESFTKTIARISNDLFQKYHQRAGSTLVSSIVTEKDTIVASVGDSRAYTVADGQISLVTSDESVVWQEMQQRNNNSKPTNQELDDLRFAPGNNRILRCMGQPNLEQIQTRIIPNDSYETLLLLSDGVTDLLSQDDIRIIAETTPREEVTKALVEIAKTSDAVKKSRFWKSQEKVVQAGKDNATAAMFRR